MVDLEISLVETFKWSLRDIDETDIESLLAFISRLSGPGRSNEVKLHCDEVTWL